MNEKQNNLFIETELTNRIKCFGEQINQIVTERRINYLIPLETKGALLVDVACGKIDLPKSLNIIYPRALRYIPSSDIASSRILLVDDIFFSGGHLNRVYNKVKEYGARPDNVYCLALLDFSCGDRDKDYVGEMHDRICENILPGLTLKRSDTLLFLQNEMLEKTMPSVYDHLTIEARGVENDKYLNLLAMFSDKNRLLHYGQRGAYQASSILLDDLFEGEWDVPAKVRLWYNSNNKTLRITPVGFISADGKNTKKDISECLYQAIIKPVISDLAAEKEEAEYEALVLAARLQQLILLKKTLYDLKFKFSLDTDHLNRYYPGLDVVSKITGILRDGAMTELPDRPNILNDQSYSSAVSAVLNLTRQAWENQPAKLRKDRERNGYTAAEIFNLLKDFSKEALHAALDFCFDFHYLAVFRRRDKNGLSRCYRSTEISGNYLPEEIYGAAIIYSIKGPTPDWLINKVFPILRSIMPGRINDGHFVISKAYFGDITRIKQSEDSTYSWKDVQTELWDSEDFGGGVRYRKKEDPIIQEKVKNLLDDPRISGFRDTLASVIFLLENGGRNAGILLDILTPGYGGTDYISHNIEKILSFGLRSPDDNSSKNIQWHSKGADEKLDILIDLFDNENNLIDKLFRRSTRLQSSYLIQLQAEKAVKKARPFASRTLYDALRIIKKAISGAVIAANRNDFHGFSSALETIGIRSIERSHNLRNLLAKTAQKIYPVLKAISGHTYYWEYYGQYLIGKHDSCKYILGYDLTGERRKVVPDGEELTRFDDQLHKFIANWIVAFNGKLSTLAMNAGDLRFGFFQTLDEAISAACWILHHIEQLNYTSCFPIGPEVLGMVVTQGNFKVDSVGNSSGGILDMSGHWLKGKIIERDKLDVSTGKVGRKSSGLQDSQLWILEHETFEVDRTSRTYINEKYKVNYKDGVINLSPVDTASFIMEKQFPWIDS
jgi:hypothetical protein